MKTVTQRIVNFLKDGNEFASADLADFYQLTTGQLLMDMEDWHTVGNMVLRGDGRETYAIMAGWRYVLPVIADMVYDDAFIDWAARLVNKDGKRLFGNVYLDKLRGRPLPIRIDGIPDGAVIFSGPLARVSGPPLATKWVDSIINDTSRRAIGIATKISRLFWASGGKVAFADNSMRRSADITGLMTGDIANAMGVLTSNMAVARANGTTPVGTMDHWYLGLKVMQYFDLHPDAKETSRADNVKALCHAYREFMRCYPEDGTLLLDLAILEIGLEAAILVLKEFHPKRYGVRLDSGDLGKGSKYIEQRLRANGLEHLKISLTGGLRAINMQNIVQSGAQFDVTGIGEYFQPRGETGRAGSPLEVSISTDIVTKFGFGENPRGLRYSSIKISDMPEKASRGGMLDLWVLSDAEAEGREAYVEVDLARSELILQDGKLTRELESRRLGNGKNRTYAVGTTVRQPMVPLLDNTLATGERYVGASLLTDEAMRARYQAEFARIPADLKKIDGNHGLAPVGLEYAHFSENREMAERGALIHRW
ncbi:MAG: hypothetical protein DI585_01535 [Pseudomonas fluorescens]|nr:MAG: hypothetical protein DI585_01535 [Pseudomonas fluorescens]